MRASLFLLSCFFTGAICVPSQPVPRAAASVKLGKTTFVSDLSLVSGVTSFLGIPYAAPPVGSLRWKPPVAPTTPAGSVRATAQPNQCPQAGFGLQITNPYASITKRDVATSEDCLYLNVHVPSTATPSSKLPVVIWIHGGGYDSGSTSLYPAQDIVAQAGKQLIAVGIQFRQGVFGFLAGSKVKSGGTLNVGLLDQQAAFKWVQANIAQFGGDPTKVTIWGSSSGAGSVLQHIIANGGNTSPQLFRTAIMSSPFLPFQYKYNDGIPENLYSQIVSAAGCSSAADSLACLRAADVNTLTNAEASISSNGFLGAFTFVPVVDGTFITDRPTSLLSNNKVNGQTLHVVTNQHDGNIFLTGIPDVTLQYYIGQLFSRLSSAQKSQAIDLYSKVAGTVKDQEALSYGENILICPAYYALAAFANARKAAYKAEFAISPANHGDDLSYIFKDYAVPPSFTDPTFFTTFSTSFLSTAISSNPNNKIDKASVLPNWPQFAPQFSEMLFNVTASGARDIRAITTDQDIIRRCQFWAGTALQNSQ